MGEKWKVSQSFCFSCAIFLGAIGLFAFLNSPFFLLKEIQVEGNEFYTDEEILTMSGIYSGQNAFRIDEEAAVRALRADSRIKSVRIERQSLTALRVSVVEREAMAAMKYGSGYLLLDDEGIFIGQAVDLPDTPLITGGVEPGVKLGSKARSVEVQAALKFLTQLEPSTLRALSELSLRDPSRIVLYAREGTTVVLGPATEMEEKARVFEGIWKDARQRRKIPQLIDLTSPRNPVVK